MTPAVMAMLALFNGHDLTGWIVLQGKWEAKAGNLVCTSAPAAIRSSFESDAYTLEFQFRHADKGVNRLVIHSDVDGLSGMELSPGADGAVANPHTRRSAAVPSSEWIRAKVETGPQQTTAASFREDGSPIEGVMFLRVWTGCTQGPPKRTRGFLRLTTTEPGIELRDIKVSEPGFVNLFDGNTLKGWQPVNQKEGAKPNWVAEDGAIKCMHVGNGVWLRTDRTYSNFVLRLEYQLAAKGNSGVYVRAPLKGRISQAGMEIQLLDDAGWAARIKGPQHTGSVYCGIAPEAEVSAPAEQWNAIEIVLDGKRVRTTLNGVQLYDARLDDKSKDQMLLGSALATRPAQGYIGLQDHTGQLLFRNIRIRELRPPGHTSPAS